MQILRILILSVLIITTPTLFANPPQTIQVRSKKLEKNFRKRERFDLVTYDQIISLIEEVESGRAEERYKDKNIRRINRFLAYLAAEGSSSDSEDALALASDVEDLLGDDYEYAFAVNFLQADPTLCKNWFSSNWEKTKTFVKNHKKEILIGAAIVVGATIVVVAVLAASSTGAAAALAGAAGAAAEAKSSEKADIPTLLEHAGETEILKAAVREHIAEFKEFVAEDIVIQTTDVEREPTFGEKARELGAYFAHETFEEIADLASLLPQLSQELNDLGDRVIPGERSSDPYENYHNLVAQGHKMIDGIFSTELSDIYSEEAKAQKPLNEYAIGELPPPGSFSRGLKTSKLRKAVEAGKETTVIAEELGFTANEITQLEKAGKLEKAVADGMAEQKILESYKTCKDAETFLRPYQGKYIPEARARELIHQAGLKTYPRPKGVPDKFRVRISNNGGGMLYVHPENQHISIRVMPGKPHSPNPYQRKPYVIHRKHGRTLNKIGEIVDGASVEAHIPLEEFIFN